MQSGLLDRFGYFDPTNGGASHRYALSLDIDTLVLGVKNRRELTECVAAAEAGPLPRDLIARIDASMEHARTA